MEPHILLCLFWTVGCSAQISVQDSSHLLGGNLACQRSKDDKAYCVLCTIMVNKLFGLSTGCTGCFQNRCLCNCSDTVIHPLDLYLDSQEPHHTQTWQKQKFGLGKQRHFHLVWVELYSLGAHRLICFLRWWYWNLWCSYLWFQTVYNVLLAW